jgi:N-acetylmuramoyl-L-alanine amidase
MPIKQMGNAHTNSSGRDGHVPCVIVDHISAGTMSSMDGWFTSPANEVSSAHFGVSKTGEIHQYVPIERMAWGNGLTLEAIARATAPIIREHAGVNPNKYTVSIEHEGTDGELTEAQFAASVWLHRYIRDEVQRIYGQTIRLDEQHVIGHFQVDPVRKPNCPGPKFPWARLYQTLREEKIPVNPSTKTPLTPSEDAMAKPLAKWEARFDALTAQLEELNARCIGLQKAVQSEPVPDWAKDAYLRYSAFIQEPSGTEDFWRLLTVLYRKEVGIVVAPPAPAGPSSGPGGVA